MGMMHEARHRDQFSLFYIISDMSGMSSLRYQLEHSWHHNWPNCPAGEIEQSFAYAPGMRHFTWPFISAAAGLHPLTWDNYAGYLIVFLANWFSCSFWLTLINVPAHLTMDELEDKDVQDIDFAKTQIAHSRTFSAGSRY